MIDLPPAHAPWCDQVQPSEDSHCPACTWFLDQQAFSRFIQLVQQWAWWQFSQGRGQG